MSAYNWIAALDFITTSIMRFTAQALFDMIINKSTNKIKVKGYELDISDKSDNEISRSLAGILNGNIDAISDDVNIEAISESYSDELLSS